MDLNKNNPFLAIDEARKKREAERKGQPLVDRARTPEDFDKLSSIILSRREAQPEPVDMKKPESPVEEIPVSSGGSETSPLADTVSRNITEVKSNATAPDDSGLRKSLQAIDKYHKEFKAAGVDTSDIDGSIREAKKLFKEERTRNEALSLAQLIGQSLARMGAALYGQKQGRTILGDINIPTVDYEKRTEGARQDYRDEIATQEARRRELKSEAVRREGEDFRRGLAPLSEQLDVEKMKYRENQDNYRRSLQDRIQDARLEKTSADANRRFGAADYKNAQVEEGKLNEKLQAVDELTNALTSTDKKTQSKVPVLAGKAGLDADALEQIKEETKKPGAIFGDLWKSEDPAAAASAVKQSLMSKLQPELDALKARKEVARRMAQTGEDEATAAAALLRQSSAPASQSGTQEDKRVSREQLQSYMQAYSMDEKTARDYLKSQGYQVD